MNSLKKLLLSIQTYFVSLDVAGMSSSATPVSFQGSPMATESGQGGLISVQFSGNPLSDPNGPDSGSPKYVHFHICYIETILNLFVLSALSLSF